MKNEMNDLIKHQKEFMKHQKEFGVHIKTLGQKVTNLFIKEYEEKFPTLEVYYGYKSEHNMALMGGAHCDEYKPDIQLSIFCCKGEYRSNSRDLLKMFNITNENKFVWTESPFFLTDKNRLSPKEMEKFIEDSKEIFTDTLGGVTVLEMLNFINDFNQRHFGMEVIHVFKTQPNGYVEEDEDEE